MTEVGPEPARREPFVDVEPPPDAEAVRPALPGPGRLVGRSLAVLRRVAPNVRRGALAIGLQFLGLLGPVLVLVAAAIARLPDPTILFGDGPPAAPADAELVGLVGIGMLVALAGGTALAVESRAIGLGLLGAAAQGRSFALSAALRRSRQSFWRLVGLSLAIELPLGVVGSFLGEALAGPSAAGSPLATGLGFLVGLVLQVPIVYAAPGIVLGDLGLRAALRASVGLVRATPRLVPVVVGVGAAAQVLLVIALNGGLEIVARVAEAADLGLTGDPLRTFAAIALLLGATSAAGSLFFTVTCLAVAPQALVAALARPTPGLDRALTEEAASGPSRWLTVPMVLAIATAVVVSVVGIQNVVGRG